jgi:TRAP-type C4-dicarboxylate transport system permease small subunit
MLRTVAKLLVAGACLGAICWLGVRLFFGAGIPTSEIHKLVGVLCTVFVGGAVFFGAAYLLRVAELRDLVEVAQRKLRR